MPTSCCRHGTAYLAALAILAVGGLLLALRSVPRRERRAYVAELIEGLPCGGSGPAFTAVSFIAQFGFFAVTQIGEGCPLCGGDIVTGVFAAAVAAGIGALVVALGKRRFIEFALALVFALVAALRDDLVTSALLARRTPPATATRRSPFSFRYRPPPALSTR